MAGLLKSSLLKHLHLTAVPPSWYTKEEGAKFEVKEEWSMDRYEEKCLDTGLDEKGEWPGAGMEEGVVYPEVQSEDER